MTFLSNLSDVSITTNVDTDVRGWSGLVDGKPIMVICEGCDHGNSSGILVEVVELAHRILKHPLNGGDSNGTHRAMQNLHQLNEYWIRHYSEL